MHLKTLLSPNNKSSISK